MEELLFFVDIGNTIIDLAIFSDDKLLNRLSISTRNSELDDIKKAATDLVNSSSIKGKTFKGGLISSVVPNISRLVQIAILNVIDIEIPIMDERYNSLLKIRIDNPKELGGDLLSDIATSLEEYNCPALIVDLGTITKFLLINEKGEFIGTNFFPGLGLCSDLMSEKTALLTKVDNIKPHEKYMGTNTPSSMENGLYYGMIHMIEGYKNKLKNDYPNLNLILTGGYSILLKDSLHDFIYDKDLTLKGIKTLYRKGIKNGL